MNKVLNIGLVEQDCDADDLIEYVGHLMNWYSRKPSAYLANIIVSNLELIEIKIEKNECDGLDCECSRLLKKWRYQAQFRKHQNLTLN